jgi:hypothetical protein
MDFTKSLHKCICILLFMIVFGAGCMNAATKTSCPIPQLKFNNSQELTKFDRTSSMRIVGHNLNYSYEPGTIPLRGVIYHEDGFTRIFDSTGTQILLVNDSDSITLTPMGPLPVTYVYGVTSEDMQPKDEGNITEFYQKGDDICIAAIIYTPGSFKPTAMPPL